MFIAGCMLYWGEGAKSRNQLQFANADPEMARFFVDFLRRYFGLSDEIRITCRLYADHLARQKEVEDFWLETLALRRTALRKSVVNVYSKYSERRRVGNLPYGTCHVVVSRTWLTQTIFGRHPGDRRFHARGLAGIDTSCPRARKSVTTGS